MKKINCPGCSLIDQILNHYPLWKYIARRILPEDPEAQKEVIGTAITKVLQANPNLETEDDVVRYFARAVRTCGYDFVRKAKREICVELPEVADPHTPETIYCDTEEETALQRDIRAVLHHLTNLPRRNEEVIRAVFLNGMSMAEYVRERRIPYSTAKSRLERGLVLLRTTV